MGNDESHFNISLFVRDKVQRQCRQTTTFEEKGEPKLIRTEIPLLTARLNSFLFLFFLCSERTRRKAITAKLSDHYGRSLIVVECNTDKARRPSSVTDENGVVSAAW